MCKDDVPFDGFDFQNPLQFVMYKDVTRNPRELYTLPVLMKLFFLPSPVRLTGRIYDTFFILPEIGEG